MRLIDADSLHELIDYGFDIDFNEVPETKRELLRMVDEQATIDAVPVVRCKDCKYWRDDDCKNDNHGYCPISENDFCSRGERKDE